MRYVRPREFSRPWSILLAHHIRRHDDVSARSKDVQIGHWKGSISFKYQEVYFYSVSGGSVFFYYLGAISQSRLFHLGTNCNVFVICFFG